MPPDAVNQELFRSVCTSASQMFSLRHTLIRQTPCVTCITHNAYNVSLLPSLSPTIPTNYLNDNTSFSHNEQRRALAFSTLANKRPSSLLINHSNTRARSPRSVPLGFQRCISYPSTLSRALSSTHSPAL